MYQLAFDTLWTLATVLNYTETLRIDNESRLDPLIESCSHLPGELVPLDEFTYSNAFMGCVMKENYHKVNFTGVSVSVCMCRTTVVYTKLPPSTLSNDHVIDQNEHTQSSLWPSVSKKTLQQHNDI